MFKNNYYDAIGTEMFSIVAFCRNGSSSSLYMIRSICPSTEAIADTLCGPHDIIDIIDIIDFLLWPTIGHDKRFPVERLPPTVSKLAVLKGASIEKLDIH
jgi:hypothetical protein